MPDRKRFGFFCVCLLRCFFFSFLCFLIDFRVPLDLDPFLLPVTNVGTLSIGYDQVTYSQEMTNEQKVSRKRALLVVVNKKRGRLSSLFLLCARVTSHSF